MNQNFTKIMYIVNCLVSFCHHAGATDYNVQFNIEQNIATFEIRTKIHNLDSDLLNTLSETLKLERSHEVEQDYWELAGEADSHNELMLIGMMLDESSVTYENNILEIKVVRR